MQQNWPAQSSELWPIEKLRPTPAMRARTRTIRSHKLQPPYANGVGPILFLSMKWAALLLVMGVYLLLASLD